MLSIGTCGTDLAALLGNLRRRAVPFNCTESCGANSTSTEWKAETTGVGAAVVTCMSM
jgi:hypothetical protein